MTDSIIKMRGLSKIFSTEAMDTYALKNVDLAIDAGDYVSISGPSGCGKSTLLSIIGLLDTPTSGNYVFDGIDARSISLDESAVVRNEKIGFVFQQFNLIDELSVHDNVALPLRYNRSRPGEAETTARVTECLEQVGMTHRVKHKPNQLSGGEQQRVAIARSLVANPTILLVDEATGNLDSTNSDMIMELLAKLNAQGTTICMVTHDPRYAGMANVRFKLSDGQIASRHKGLKAAI